MFRFILVILSFMTAGCATTHPGELAESNVTDIAISVDRNDDLSDKHYLFYEYTIENKSPEWKQVQVVDVHFDGQQSEVLTDSKLSAWIEGAELKLKASQYNQELLLGSMAAVGGLAAVTSGNKNVQGAGVAVMAGAAVGATATSVSRAQGNANSGVKGVNGTVNVPGTHVFVPSKVAPDSYIRRWVVVQAPPVPAKNVKAFNNFNGNKATAKVKLVSKVLIDGTRSGEFTATVGGGRVLAR